MSKHALPSPMPFTGNFAPEHRQRLRQLRQRLGLSYQELANYFNMSWSTFRKWENGETPTCHPRHVGLVRALLNGEYDERLHASHEPIESLLDSWRRMPALMHQCMERIASTYDLCQSNPEVCANLVERLNLASSLAIGKLLDGEK
ncbi:MAG: helix-turn-helix domain-containing protein [Victivallales bacterium]|nr:helix-turn-helix domain-containing protein [Victivallales bacterium]